MPLPPPPSRPRIRRGLWFPLCLGLLVLVALPGAVLLALSLFGLESAANRWLRNNFSLSYHNPLPTAAAVFLFLIPPVLVLLYFLKLRRKPTEVPSTFLWRKSIEDLHVNSLFQWLRDNVLLLVQLCVVLLLIYSALAFQVHGRSTSGGKYYILLIDSSASMSTTDVTPNRLEVARADALNEVDSRPDGDTGMVIEFNSRASILQPYTRDKALLRAAVRRIGQTGRTTHIDEALTLADSLANPLRSGEDQAVKPSGEDASEARTYVSPDGILAEVHLFSDGRFPAVPNFTAGNLSVVYHRAGAPGADAVNNVGIVNFSAVRDDKDVSKLQVFARMLNFRKEPADVTVELEWRVVGKEDFEIKEAKVRLPGRFLERPDPEKAKVTRDNPGEASVTFDLPDIDEGADVVLHARLKGHKDQFALDDEVWLVAGVTRKARVLIVTPGNEILHDFFDTEDSARVAAVTYLTPADMEDGVKYVRPTTAGEYDLVIFDRCAPPDEKAVPRANAFYIDSVPPPWSRKAMPALKGAAIRNPASSHPLMRDLTGLDEIAFSDAFRFDLRAEGVPPRVPRLLEADRETSLLFELPRGSFKDLVLTFPLVDDKGRWTTNWNLKLSFPVFLRNVLYQLGNVNDAAAEETIQPGQVKVLRPEGSPARIEVREPGKGSRAVTRGSSAEFVLQETEKVGVYQATWPGGGRAFAVNLLDAVESNTQPRDVLEIGEQNIEADQTRLQSYDTWKWVALAALVLLVLEWAVYHRRVWL